jgi:hypothetical protein
MRFLKTSIILAAAAAFATSAFAADMPTKAPPGAFATAASSGWYIGAGTEGSIAASDVSGTAFSLTGGNLTAGGGSVVGDVGRIWNACIGGTWCQVEVDGKYQNIGGANTVGSVNSRWAVSAELDVGAEVVNQFFAAIGSNLNNPFPTFNPTSLLPAAVNVAATPRPYFGIVGQGTEINGTFGSLQGQTFNFSFGPKTGYRWQTLGTNGLPNNGSLNVYAQILFANKGVDMNGLFATAGGTPLGVHASAEMTTWYMAGIHYDLGIK